MRPVLFCLLLALGWVSPAVAAGPEKGQVFFSVLGGAYDEPDNLDLEDGDASVGGAVGYAINDRWSVEAMLFDFDPDVEVGGVPGKGDMDYWSANVIGKLGDGDSFQPYLVFGGGRAEYEYDGLQTDEDDTLLHGGVGFFVDLTERLTARADVRGVYHNGAADFSPMATVGLTLLLGNPQAAPAPVPVPAAAPADSDGDGVTDPNDACPGTPRGAPVNARGCPRDSDGDGVPDQRDDCPTTPAGVRVDERGCERKVAQPVSFDLTVQFATESAEITGVAFQELLELLRFLREHPSTDAEIAGHTDDTGAAEYNQNLSDRRAQAVMQALTNSGIDRERLTARGYGESRPIASNATADGRAQNRRVTVVVSGTE